MANIKTRIILFLGVCIVLRLGFVFIAKYVKSDYLPYLGLLALVPVIGFITFYFRETKKGAFGGKTWWKDLRPVHASLYILFSLLALKKNKYSWVPLLVDVIIGLIAFFFHYRKNLKI